LRRLGAYTGGFLFSRPIRRILELSGWRVTPAIPPTRAEAVAVWGRRPVSARGLWVHKRFGVPLLNVEDAWLRSVRPGPEGEAPLGLLLDSQALHFDATQPSELEHLLATADLDTPEFAERAQHGIAFLKEHGLTKYSGWEEGAELPERGYVLVIDQTAGDAAIAHAGAGPEAFQAMLTAAKAAHPDKRILLRTHPVTASGHRKGHFGPSDCDEARVTIFSAPVNPWHLLEGAVAVYAVSSQLGFEAILAGHRPVLFGQPFYAGWGLSEDRKPVARRVKKLSVEALFAGAMLVYPVWYDPFRDRLCDFETVAETLAAQSRAWRENARPLICAGMKPWKHKPVSDFLRGGSGAPGFESEPLAAIDRAARGGQQVMLWAGKDSAEVQAHAQAKGVEVWRVEDGFLRSVGLGAQLLPAASLVFDDLGIYFDPTRESRLERLIAASVQIGPGPRQRAKRLGEAIVAARLTKYNVGQTARIPAPDGKRVVLVPGQVEDDASIRLGTTDVCTNLGLLARAREVFPNDYVVFKPHPDVEIGLRAGAVPEQDAARLADYIARDMSAAEAMDQADVVVTMTSLMGFEALLRGREVHCLGMPFYAGWGLTEDHGQVAPRRVAGPDLTALIHATLIAYPRYFDAVTGLACPPEVILDRLAGGGVSRPATVRHKLVAAAQYRLRHFAKLWR